MPTTVESAVLDAALTGLTASPKTLPPWLFYDEPGSQLFEQITALPEYYLTRTESAIFTRLAPTLPAHLAAPVTIAELGAGSASKTGILLRAFADHQTGLGQAGLIYQPIDISPSALAAAAASIAAGIPGVLVEHQAANYITERYSIARPARHRVLALYIGSSIGNFPPGEAIAILRNLRAHLEPGDSLLLGVDLAPSQHKSVAQLLAAYDDAAGVTAAFNKNILTRLNRELDAGFDLAAFAHRVRWNQPCSRIEMHLESLVDQTVTLAGKRIAFAAGETIHTENSYKFTRPALRDLLTSSGFAIDAIHHDPAHLFAVTLANVVAKESQ